jgi:hypothetical protein
MTSGYNSSLTESYYQDGARDAIEQREALITKLLWHQKQSDTSSDRLFELIGGLIECRPDARCDGNACPECVGAMRRRTIEIGQKLDEAIKRDGRSKTIILSLAPDFGRVDGRDVLRYDLGRFRARVAKILQAVGVERYLLMIDARYDHRAEHSLEFGTGDYQFQFWGICEEPEGEWRRELKMTLDPNGLIAHPLVTQEHQSLDATIAYGMKNTFTRRVSLPKYDKESTYWDTRSRPLNGMLLAKLLIKLSEITLRDRILLSGAHRTVRRPAVVGLSDSQVHDREGTQ